MRDGGSVEVEAEVDIVAETISPNAKISAPNLKTTLSICKNN